MIRLKYNATKHLLLGRNVDDTISCGTIDGVAFHSIRRTTALFVPHLPVILIIAMIKYILQFRQIHLAIRTNTFYIVCDSFPHHCQDHL